MHVRYSQWTEDSQTSESRLEQLTTLFSSLLLQVNADMELALRVFEQINDRYDVLGDMTMQEFVDYLRDRGFLTGDTTPQAGAPLFKKMRDDAFREVFGALKKSQLGNHETPQSGKGIERMPETRTYEFGDTPSMIDVTQTVTNALKRHEIESFSLQEEDIRVHETEFNTSCSTVLLIDISHSMILYGEDRITPAKQTAMALAEFVTRKFPKDLLEVVAFGDQAARVPVEHIPAIAVGPYHTNTRDALRMARSILRRARGGNKQVFMITDGKPSAMFEDNGRLYKNSFGLDPRIVNKTLDEAVACRRDGITISTFMIARDQYLVDFVEELTKANHGRAFFSGLNRLGELILVDYLSNRRKKLKGYH